MDQDRPWLASEHAAREHVQSNRIEIRSRPADEFAELLCALVDSGYSTAIETLGSGCSISVAESERLQEVLALTISNGNVELLSSLLAIGISPDARFGDMHLLTYASAVSSTDCALHLIEHGADPDAADADGSTPLLWATQEDAVEIVDALIRVGCILSPVDGDGDTPAWKAAGEGNARLLSKFLDLGIDPDSRHTHPSWNGYTLLMFAALYNHYPVIELLLHRGADANYIADDGKDALAVAKEYAEDEVVDLLIVHKRP